MQGTLQGQIVNNVIHLRDSNDLVSPAGVVFELKTYFLAYLKTVQSDKVAWNLIMVKNLSVASQETYQGSFTNIVGTLGGIVHPNFSAVLWSLRTGLADRSHRGRLYIAGVVSSQAGDGYLTSAYQTSNQTAITNLLTRYGIGNTQSNMEWGVYSRKLSTFSPITNIVLRTNVMVQRRRNIGVGI